MTLGVYRAHSTGSALYNPDETHRLVLTRRVTQDRNRVLFIMLNPSTATETHDDPTIRRCIGYAYAWGFGLLTVCNIFSLRATDPKELYAHPEPSHPWNNDAIQEEASSADLIVAAWGNHGALNGRGDRVHEMLDGSKLHHLRLTKDGHPGHPLYLPKTLRPTRWLRPLDGACHV